MPKTILVIEDDRSVARLFQDALESEGWAVVIETDGEVGLRAFGQRPFDLVILDVLLPKIVGFDLVAAIRKAPRGAEVPIVMVSGVYRAAGHRDMMIERYGVLEYLDKPVDIDRLRDVIRRAIGSGGRASSKEGAQASKAVTTRIQVPALSPASLVADLATAPKAAPPRSATLSKLLSAAATPRRGELEKTPFARLLGQLYAVRATGALMLKKATVKKIVHLHQGVPVFVKSNLLGECLGHVMVGERLITQQQCDKSIERMKRDGKRQGEVLVALGLISPHNLEFALERQMEIKLFDIFSWLEGSFLFNDQDNYTGPQVNLPMSPAEMIYEGVRRTMSADRIKRELTPALGRPVPPPSDPTFRYQALGLEPRGAKLIDAIDGRTTLGTLLERSELDKNAAALLLYTLGCARLIGIFEDAPVDRARALIERGSTGMSAMTAAVLGRAGKGPHATKGTTHVGPAPAPAAAPAPAPPLSPAAPAPSPSALLTSHAQATEQPLASQVQVTARPPVTAQRQAPWLDSAQAPLPTPEAEAQVTKEIPRAAQAQYVRASVIREGPLVRTTRPPETLIAPGSPAISAPFPIAAPGAPAAPAGPAAPAAAAGPAAPAAPSSPVTPVTPAAAPAARWTPAPPSDAAEAPTARPFPIAPVAGPFPVAPATEAGPTARVSTELDSAALAPTARVSTELDSAALAPTAPYATVLDAPALSPGAEPSSSGVIALGDADLEVLRTGEVSVELPALSALAAARAKAKAAGEEALAQHASGGFMSFASPNADAIETLEVSSASIVGASPAPRYDTSLVDHDAVVSEEDAPPPPAAPLHEPAIEPERPSLLEQLTGNFRLPRPPAHEKPAEKAVPQPTPTAMLLGASAERAGSSGLVRPIGSGLHFVEREKAKAYREIEEELSRLRKKNHYERLGVHRLATDEEIRAAFERVAKDRHPDRVLPSHTSREGRTLAEEAYNLLRRALETLLDAEERREYDRALGAEDSAAGEAALIAAERAYELGLELEAEGDWIGACEALMEACDNNPDEGTYLAHQAWASFSANPNDRDAATRAIADLESAIERSPKLEDAYVFLGLIHEKLGSREEAVKNLRRALQCNADSVRALRAIRNLGPAEEKKSLLGRLRGS